MEANTKKILLVEDEEAIRTVLADKLRREGFQVIEGKDGEEGLSLSLREHPDLILLDIVMPKMDGLTVLKKLREDEWGKEVKVILLTNLSDVDKVAEALHGGSYNYLVKSDWKIEDVVKKVKEELEVE